MVDVLFFGFFMSKGFEKYGLIKANLTKKLKPSPYIIIT